MNFFTLKGFMTVALGIERLLKLFYCKRSLRRLQEKATRESPPRLFIYTVFWNQYTNWII